MAPRQWTFQSIRKCQSLRNPPWMVSSVGLCSGDGPTYRGESACLCSGWVIYLDRQRWRFQLHKGVVGILASPRTAAFVVGPKELHTDPRWLVITMCHDVKGSPLRQREFPSMSSPFGPCHFSLTPPRPSANQVIASYVPGRSHGREA